MQNIFGTTSESNYSLIEFLDQSAFDEKFSINLKEDKIKNIYHIENKYYVPILEGRFHEVYEYALDNMVHPDDSAFNEFMNPETLEIRLKENNGSIKAECREKMVDDSYRWVQYVMVSGKNNGVLDDLIYCYVYDIQNQKDRQSGKISIAYHVENRNTLTGLIYREEFIPRAIEKVKNSHKKWCVIAIDIQHFKVFNEWFGREKGDYVLARIGLILRELEKREECVCAYFGRDNFGVFIEFDEQLIQDLYERIKDVVYLYSNIIGFLPAFGVNILIDTSHFDLDEYDKARVAVEDAKKGYMKRICYFDHVVYNKKKADYAMLTDFQHALQSDEISFYIQPQCNIVTGKIIGGEALVRWIKPDGKVISPGAFVPFLERSGFITELDKYTWESVVKWIRSMMNKEISMIPISINVSQVDLLSMDVASYLYGLVERYNVPPRLLKVEITESAYADNFDLITEKVSKIKEKGFLVFMDDFGAGYSSLNMLDKVNVDVLKLDMAFMRKNTSLTKKGISIVESIISMTKTLNIPMIVEGVEKASQIEFLNSLGCLYAQGYFFYKPMPIDEFTSLIQQDDILDYAGIRVRATEIFHTREFLNEDLFNDSMLNNILGPVAFYTQGDDGMLNIIRFNQQFYDCIADVEMDSRKTGIQHYIFEEDLPDFYKMLKDAMEDSINGGECTVRFSKSRGGEFWYHMHLYYLRDIEQGKLFYGKVTHATEMYQQGKAFYDLLKKDADSCMRIDLSSGLIFELDKNMPFDDPNARVMDVEQSLYLTAIKHIDDEREREKFISFFNPARLKQSHQAGIYCESFHTDFLFGGRKVNTVFSAYYIKFIPNQADNVYIFINREY